jgi:hypothetical protein
LKKRSGASSTNEPPEPLVLFVDRSLGNRVVASALRAAGAHVEIHDDHFPTTALDEDWLGEVGRRGWVVLTKDQGIRHRAPALAAIRVAAVRLFVLTAGDLRGSQMADIFARATSRIAAVARREPPPFIARVARTGVVSVLLRARQLR